MKPTLNKGHSLARGLTFCAPGLTTGGRLVDLVSQQNAPPRNGARQYGRRGLWFPTSDDADYNFGTTLGNLVLLASPFSIFVRLRHDNSSQTWATPLQLGTDATDSPFVVMGSNSTQYRPWTFGSETNQTDINGHRHLRPNRTSDDYPVGEWYTIGITFDGVDNQALGSYAGYTDGIAETLQASANFADAGNPAVTRVGGVDVTNYGMQGLVSHAFVWNRVLTQPEFRALTRNPNAFLERKILVPVAGAGAAPSSITGSGAVQAQAATVSGSGVKENIGSGTPQAQASTASGAGVKENVGSGAPQAQAATASGAGTKENIGSGTPQAQAATASGVGVKENIGSGTPQAQAATTVGTGNVTAAGTVVGSGAVQAQDATASGSGLKVVTGSGAVQAQSASITAVATHDNDFATDQGGGSGGLEYDPNYRGRMRRPKQPEVVELPTVEKLTVEDDAVELALIAIAVLEKAA